MIRTLLKEVKEFKANPGIYKADVHDSGSAHGNDDSVFDGFYY